MAKSTKNRSKNPAKRKANPHRRRKKNGAGLGAFIGSLGGAVATGVITALGAPAGITLPLGIALSAAGGAYGGQYAAPKDRKRRGAEGGGIGGIFGPIGAAIGGYVGGLHPDKRKNPSSAVVTGTVLAIAAVGTGLGVRHVMKKRAAAKELPSKQPGATPDNQGAGPMIPIAQVPKAVLDAELLKGGVPLEPWWKTVGARIYKDRYIRIDEDMRLVQPYIDASGASCVQATVRWIVIAGEATPLATGTLDKFNACSSAPINALDAARAKVYDKAALTAMDWIDTAFPAKKIA